MPENVRGLHAGKYNLKAHLASILQPSGAAPIYGDGLVPIIWDFFKENGGREDSSQWGPCEGTMKKDLKETVVEIVVTHWLRLLKTE